MKKKICKKCPDESTEENGLCFVCDTLAADSSDEYARINDPFETGDLVHTGSSE